MTAEVLVGEELAGFRVEALIGRGGMSRVYRAEQLTLGRKVALKVLAPEFADDGALRSRFLYESRLAATIEHLNILPIYEAGEASGHLFIAMRYIDGISLGELLRREGRLPPSQTLDLLEQASSALDAAHRQGLVHRDVKPANLLIDEGHVYLADFGIARPVATALDLTRTGAFVGTIDYAAPEQIRNETVDSRADIYALGCVLYQCLTGNVPYDRPSEYARMNAHLHEAVPRASVARPTLPTAIDHVIATALAKNKKDRYATAVAFIAAARLALEQAEVSRNPSARADERTLIDRPIRRQPVADRPSWYRRSPWWELGSAVLVVGLLGVGLGAGLVRVTSATSTAPPPSGVPLVSPASAVPTATSERRPLVLATPPPAAVPSSTPGRLAPSAVQIGVAMSRTVERDLPSTHFTQKTEPLTISDGAGSALTAVVGVRNPTADGYGQLVFFWRDTEFLGWDSLFEHASVSVSSPGEGAFAVSYANYRPTDSLCCPSLAPVTITYRWSSSGLQASGTPPTFGTAIPVRLLP